MEVILEVIGTYGRTADINQFMQRDKHGIRTLEQIAFLKGVRLAVASELEGNARLNEALLKRLTGGDTLTAARLHKEQFTFSPHFKIWMLMNHLPLTEDNTEGFGGGLELFLSTQISRLKNAKLNQTETTA